MARERIDTKKTKISKTDTDRDDFHGFISEVAEGIKIDKHGLDEELVRQPELFYKVSERLALTLSQRDAAKEELKFIEAEADESIRDGAAKSGDKKPNETEIKALVTLDPAVKKAAKDLTRLNNEVGQLQALKEAFQQKSYALKEIVSLYIASYYADDSSKGAKGRQYDDNRGALQTERSRRSKE